MFAHRQLYHQLKTSSDPIYAEKNMRHMETPDSLLPSQRPEPIDSTQPIIQPFDHLAQAEQTFHDYQLQTGTEYLQSGYIPQTAAELQCLRVAEQETGQLQQSLTPSYDFMAETFAPQPDPYTNPLMQQQMMEEEMMQQDPKMQPDMMDPLMSGGGF